MRINLLDRLRTEYIDKLSILKEKDPEGYEVVTEILTSKGYHSDITISEVITLTNYIGKYSGAYTVGDIQDMFLSNGEAEKRKDEQNEK